MTDDLYNFFKTYESGNSAANFGGCEPDKPRVTFNSSTTAPHGHFTNEKSGPIAGKLRLFWLL